MKCEPFEGVIFFKVNYQNLVFKDGKLAYYINVSKIGEGYKELAIRIR